MDGTSFNHDVEQQQHQASSANASTMSQKPFNSKDGRKKVLVVGAGAAG